MMPHGMSETQGETIIGIDLGSRRIGIAVSASGIIATPHSVMKHEGDVLSKLEHLAGELEAASFVVGFPRRRQEGAGDRKYRDFAEALRQKTCKPVVLWDESLSTVEASARLEASGMSRRDSRNQIDMYAAVVILQSYLDERRRQQEADDRQGPDVDERDQQHRRTS